ncbi:nuclear transcription factor Y subunit C-10 isoform X5 [Capsicum annuum]|uniref:nuclear transcription factor Y subunit C-10 isoform X5 n=1 Tax=Capsicum annuum TaxID=4072 RepID=UPI0007BF54F9|nr:nuclear transcription factor Y subunit C-10 isoform X5 [Capsicum annuum]
MDFNSSSMELPKSSSALSSDMQRPVHMQKSMPSDKKIQQDEDERDPRFMLKEELSCFWKRQKEEILHSDLKRKHELPISRIRRAMKSNDQVKMVSAHSTVLLAKAIEMFILELTRRAWMQSEQEKRRTLKRCDIARAIRNEELFDFLSDIVPLQNYKVQEAANDVQGNELHPAHQMVKPNNNSLQSHFQVHAEANDGQGNEFRPTHQLVQPNNIPLPCQFQVQQQTNDGQGNMFDPAHQFVQPNNIPVKEAANGGQGNEFHPVYQMVQPNNIPASFTSTQGIPAPLMSPPLFNFSPEDEFIIDGFLMDYKEGL